MAFCFVPSSLPSAQRPRPFAGSRRLRLPLLLGAVDRIAASGISTRSLHTSPNVRLLSSPRLRHPPARGGRRPPLARCAMSASAAYQSRARPAFPAAALGRSLSSSPSPIFIARPLPALLPAAPDALLHASPCLLCMRPPAPPSGVRPPLVSFRVPLSRSSASAPRILWRAIKSLSAGRGVALRL